MALSPSSASVRFVLERVLSLAFWCSFLMLFSALGGFHATTSSDIDVPQFKTKEDRASITNSSLVRAYYVAYTEHRETYETVISDFYEVYLHQGSSATTQPKPDWPESTPYAAIPSFTSPSPTSPSPVVSASLGRYERRQRPHSVWMEFDPGLGDDYGMDINGQPFAMRIHLR